MPRSIWIPASSFILFFLFFFIWISSFIFVEWTIQSQSHLNSKTTLIYYLYSLAYTKIFKSILKKISLYINKYLYFAISLQLISSIIHWLFALKEKMSMRQVSTHIVCKLLILEEQSKANQDPRSYLARKRHCNLLSFLWYLGHL